jgi:MerR family transcriptional regulator, copper efflux regulator
MSELPQLLTIKGAAKLLCVTPLTLRNWDRDGKLKALRHPLNNYRVYKRVDVEKLIETIASNISPSTPRRRKGPHKLPVKHLGSFTSSE